MFRKIKKPLLIISYPVSEITKNCCYEKFEDSLEKLLGNVYYRIGSIEHKVDLNTEDIANILDYVSKEKILWNKIPFLEELPFYSTLFFVIPYYILILASQFSDRARNFLKSKIGKATQGVTFFMTVYNFIETLNLYLLTSQIPNKIDITPNEIIESGNVLNAIKNKICSAIKTLPDLLPSLVNNFINLLKSNPHYLLSIFIPCVIIYVWRKRRRVINIL